MSRAFEKPLKHSADNAADHPANAAEIWEQRWHPLREEWVIIAAHRNQRPWTGDTVSHQVTDVVPPYAADCYSVPRQRACAAASRIRIRRHLRVRQRSCPACRLRRRPSNWPRRQASIATRPHKARRVSFATVRCTTRRSPRCRSSEFAPCLNVGSSNIASWAHCRKSTTCSRLKTKAKWSACRIRIRIARSTRRISCSKQSL